MITHINRKGDVYILKTSVTRKGKPRWYASMKADKGTNAKSMPEGYEFYENVNGQVFVRKPINTRILPEEFEATERACDALKVDCKVEAGKKDIVVYASDYDPSYARELSNYAFFSPSNVEIQLRNRASYSPVFRFGLLDEDHRRFSVERMCYRSGEPQWHFLELESDLAAALEKYIPYLDDMDQFFDLI